MKAILILIVGILLSTESVQAQKHEIGIGFPTIGIGSGGTYSDAGFIETFLFRSSELYGTHMHTWRDHSVVSPILYFSSKLNKRISIRTSLAYQKEFIVHHFTPSADAGDVSEDYIGKYSQLKLTTGMSSFIRKNSQHGFYFATDITHALKHIYENGSYENWAWGYTYIDYSKNLTMYCLGINPSIGYKTFLSKSISCSYEMGFEYNYNFENGRSSGFLLLNPLNRFSINYSL